MSALTLARAPRAAPGEPLAARRVLLGHAPPLHCAAAPPARGGRALRLVRRPQLREGAPRVEAGAR